MFTMCYFRKLRKQMNPPEFRKVARKPWRKLNVKTPFGEQPSEKPSENSPTSTITTTTPTTTTLPTLSSESSEIKPAESSETKPVESSETETKPATVGPEDSEKTDKVTENVTENVVMVE